MTEHEHSDVTSVQQVETVGSIDELEAAFPTVADVEAGRPGCWSETASGPAEADVTCWDAADGQKERA